MTDQPSKPTDAQKQLAAALGRIPSGIFIATFASNGVETGMLASWVQQCSFDPPQITLAVQNGRPMNDLLAVGAAFTLNLLSEEQTNMIAHFGRGFALHEPAFEGIEIERRSDSGPILREALAHLCCRVTSRCAAGDHHLIISEVVAGDLLFDGRPMVHIRKNGMHY